MAVAAWFSDHAVGRYGCSALWNDANAELAKVPVQRNGSPDAKIVDQDLARAIRKAPTVCHALLEKDPRTLDLRWREKT